MRPAWLLFLAALLTASASAAPPGALPGALTLTITPLDGAGLGAGSEALLDVGAIAARHEQRDAPGIVLRRRVALRIDGVPGRTGSARLSAVLANPWPGTVTRVDGMIVSTVPRLIAPTHRIGSTVVHDIELTIPAGVPAGAFTSDLRWQADTD